MLFSDIFLYTGAAVAAWWGIRTALVYRRSQRGVKKPSNRAGAQIIRYLLLRQIFRRKK